MDDNRPQQRNGQQQSGSMTNDNTYHHYHHDNTQCKHLQSVKIAVNKKFKRHRVVDRDR